MFQMMLKISRKFTLCSFHISLRYFVALEAAISTKPTLKLSSMLDMCVSLCGFFVHKLQPKLWRIKHEWVRLWKTAASLLNRAWGLISGFKKAIFFLTFSTFLILKKTTNGQNYSKSIGNQYQNSALSTPTRIFWKTEVFSLRFQKTILIHT